MSSWPFPSSPFIYSSPPPLHFCPSLARLRAERPREVNTHIIIMEGRRIVSPVQEKYKDVFLSHSGRQKNFVEQLYRDLTTENVSPFLDKDPQSLPKGRPFPSRILSNARNCKVAVLVLSPDFLSSAWPMFELSAIVNAQRFFNPDMAILPLFYKITVKTLREKLNNHDLLSKWKKLQAKNDRVNCEEWHQALKEIFKFNGMEYSEDEGEVAYRDRIVDQIRRLLPPNLKYEDSLVQGNTRLCREVANLFEKAEWRNGVKVVGLYGIAGSGKTTVCESLCNFYSRKFKGKVFHAELQNDLTICIETQKRALKVLTHARDNLLASVRSKEQGSALLRARMPYHKVFVAIDNISDGPLSVEAAQSYLSAGIQEGSMILLTARSRRMLKRLLREEESLFRHVPLLEDEEAMAVLLKLTHLKLPDLRPAEIEVAKLCIRKCCFGGAYNPLALQAFGAYLFDRFGPHLLQWREIPDFRDTTAPEVEKVFCLFELSFRELSPRHVKIFMLVALYLPQKQMILEEALRWLAVACNERIAYIRDVINNLKNKGLIEEDDSRGSVRVHDLVRDFAESKTTGTTSSWCCSRGIEEAPTFLYRRYSLEGIKFTDCGFRSLPLASYNRELFANVAVLHLESVRQLTSLNLSSMKVLKSFSVRNCEEITEIQGIEHLPNIAYLALVGCNPLLKAPQIEGLTSLRWFRWGRREKPQLITRFGDLRKCQSLETLSIRCESLREYPKLGGLPNLRKIGFSDCSIVMNVPNPTACSTVSSAMTARLSLTEYSSMVTAPDLSGCLQFQFTRLDGCSALTTGPSFSGFSQLQKSWLNGRSAMITAPDLSGCSQLQTAHFQGCSALATGPNFSGFSQLRKVSFNGCSAMITAPDLGGCSQLQIAYFDGCSALITGPNFSRFSQLREVRFNGCSAMTIPPDLSGCSQLQIAYFDGCSALAAGPNFSGFSRLRDVRFNGCSAMITAPDLGGCSQLQIAYFDGCYALATGPNFSGLSKLQEVRFKGCSAMNTAPNLRGCSQLQIAHFGGCSALATGPNFSGFSQLRKVSFNGCSAMITAPNLSGCSQLQFTDFRGCSALAIVPNLVCPHSTKEFGSTDALL